MKKILVCLISVLAAAYPVAAQNILEGYAPVASPSGAYRYIRTISDTKASGKAEFDIVDIKTNAKLTSSAGATTSELKVYGTAKTTDAGMETLNVGTMNKTTGGYVKAKINKADKASAYTIQDVATVTTYRANLNGSNTTPTLKLSNTKLFPNTLPGTGNNALLSTVGKNMEWKALKDASDKSHTILVINMGAGSSAPSCTPLTATQQSNCINTGGSYDAVNCKCTCPAGKTLNTSTYKCEASSSSTLKATLEEINVVYFYDEPNEQIFHCSHLNHKEYYRGGAIYNYPANIQGPSMCGGGGEGYYGYAVWTGGDKIATPAACPSGTPETICASKCTGSTCNYSCLYSEPSLPASKAITRKEEIRCGVDSRTGDWEETSHFYECDHYAQKAQLLNCTL
ncbi:hypothetical protein Dip518_000613 [Parelusimicrobium proximum]|uniref:hypothetical protein n=1 Tax=Parelusimicrobium proximum TaxID=3228953 RepID=UPI003D17907D